MNPGEHYDNISQRAASTYLKELIEFNPSTALDEQARAAQQNLHAFFKALYEDLFQHPQAFGLPLGEDSCLAEHEFNDKDKKQAVTLKMKKPRMMIVQALDFLMLAGIQARMEGQDLFLEDYPGALKTSGVSQKFIKGLAASGLVITPNGGGALLSSSAYPGMLAAMKSLALGCAAQKNERAGKFLFARCDFKALRPGYEPELSDLYRIFGPENYAQLVQLHAFFHDKGYKTNLELGASFNWVVKYQGNRKIKATPLFQIEFDDRCANPLKMNIKCASTNRLIGLLPQQPQFLQDDFMARVFPCQGSKCDWCRNQKSLGPSHILVHGEEKVVCWFSNGDIHGIDADSVELVKQYARMHDQLLPEN